MKHKNTQKLPGMLIAINILAHAINISDSTSNLLAEVLSLFGFIILVIALFQTLKANENLKESSEKQIQEQQEIIC